MDDVNYSFFIEPRESPDIALALDKALTNVSLIVREWFHRLTGSFQFPDNYITVDIETSGLDPLNDFICTIGHTIVRDRRPKEVVYRCLNWTNVLSVNQQQLYEKLTKLEEIFKNRGCKLFHTYAQLKSGEQPQKVLSDYYDLFTDAMKRRELIIMHNGWRFDVPFIENSICRWVRKNDTLVNFSFDPELIYDSGAIEKASQLSSYHYNFPAAGETLRDFALRIGAISAKGIYWSLDKYCNEKYGLTKLAGVPDDGLHQAHIDSLLLHYLFELHRRLAGVV